MLSDERNIQRGRRVLGECRFVGACLNGCAQGTGDAVDQLVRTLHALMARRQFGDMTERYSRNRFAAGLGRAKLLKRLQVDVGLTLDTTSAKPRLEEAA